MRSKWNSLTPGKKKKVLSALLFTASLLVATIPWIMNVITQKDFDNTIDDYFTTVEAAEINYDDIWKKVDAYNAWLMTKDNQFAVSQEEYDYAESLVNPMGTTMMGRIQIEAIDVDLPFYYGLSESALQQGAALWQGTSIPSGAISTHPVLTAHTGLVKSRMFGDLYKLKEGDKITIDILDRHLTYTVTKVEITEMDDISSLYIEEGKDLLTLYTCWPEGENTHRLLVHAESDKIWPSSEVSKKTTDPVDTGTDTKAQITGIIFLAAASVSILIWTNRRKQRA